MLNRRDLFRSAAALSAASAQKILGANDRINLGVIGQALHLGNIAHLQKRQIHFDPIREEILPL